MNTLKSQIVDRIVTTAKTGLSSGTVMSRKRSTGPAPSISAASMSSLGIVMSPARTVTATNGKPWCTTLRAAMAKNQMRSVNRLVVSVSTSPSVSSTWVRKPLRASKR